MKIKVNKIDLIFSEVVRMAAGWVCSCCHKLSTPEMDNGLMDNAHNVSRSVKIIRYDPRNTTCLCRACHMRMTKDPHEHVKFFERLSIENYQFCRDRKNDNIVKLYKSDETSIFSHYKEEKERIHQLRMMGHVGNIEVRIPQVLLDK